VLLVTAALWLGDHGPGPVATTQPGNEPDPEAVRLAAANEDLKRQLALAEGGSLHLLLDLGEQRLSLFHGPARLADYAVRAVEIATRRDLLGRRAVPEGWSTAIWTDGGVRPKRRELARNLDASAPDYAERRREVLVPPTPEESQPSPRTWRIAFGDGRTLEVVAVPLPESGPATKGGRVKGVDARLRPGIRVRVHLAAGDAAALYRAIPDGIDLAFTAHSGADPPGSAIRGRCPVPGGERAPERAGPGAEPGGRL
jgi:hypothetical protein